MNFWTRKFLKFWHQQTLIRVEALTTLVTRSLLIEFLTIAIDRNALLTKERLKQAFKQFDKDSSGQITKVDLEMVIFSVNLKIFGISNIDEEIWDNILKECDLDHDGKIDFDEFTSMLVEICNQNDTTPIIKVLTNRI